jgi:hypothetical protein
VIGKGDHNVNSLLPVSFPPSLISCHTATYVLQHRREKVRCNRGPDRNTPLTLEVCVVAAELSSLTGKTRSAGFEGAAVDTGAQRSVIGLKQAYAYCRMMKVKMEFHTSHRSFRFGSTICQGMGSINIIIPVPTG